MQSGVLQPGPVRRYQTTIFVNGVERKGRWSIDRDLNGFLPSAIEGGSGPTQATGQIDWETEPSVSDVSANPWNRSTGWTPRKGDTVHIHVSDGVTSWLQGVFRIDKTTGQATDSMSSTLIDAYDDLSVTMNQEALLRQMPTRASSGPVRDIGLSAVFTVDQAMRAAGFATTALAEPSISLHVPFQGTAWAVVGETDLAQPFDTGTPGQGRPAPWGRAYSNIIAEYTPKLVRTGSSTIQFTIQRAPGFFGTARVRTWLGSRVSANQLDFVITGTQARITLNNTTVAQLEMGAATMISAFLYQGEVVIRTNLGAEVTGTATLPTGTITVYRISADTDAAIAGVMVSHPSNTNRFYALNNYKQTARLDVYRYMDRSDYLPSINDRKAIDVLSEVAAATLSAMWIDELGVLQFIGSDILKDRPVSQTITTRDDIFSLAWSDEYLASRKSVRVRYDWPSIQASSRYSVLCWENDDRVLLDGETAEYVMEPSGDEDWIMVDDQPVFMGSTGWDWPSVNAGAKSVVGGTYTDGVTEQYPKITGRDKLDVTISHLGGSKYVATAIAKAIEAGWQIELRLLSDTFSGSTALWPAWWGTSSIKLRAKGKVQRVERFLGPVAAGSTGPELDFDAGPWNSPRAEQPVLGLIAADLAEWVANPLPVITGLDVEYDPRRQLGDVIMIDSDRLMGIKLKGLIVSISNSAGDSYEQSLGVRILEVSTTWQTYEDYNQSAPNPISYQDWNLLAPVPQSYDQFNQEV